MVYVRRMTARFALLMALGLGVWIATSTTWPIQARAWVMALLHPPSAMQARLDVEPAPWVRAQLGGAVTKVAVGDGYIFAGVGPRVIMFDGAAKGDPVELAASDPLPARVKSLAALDGAIAVGYGIQDEGGPNGLALFSSGPNGRLPVQGMLPLKGVPVAILVEGNTLIVATRQTETDAVPPLTSAPLAAGGVSRAAQRMGVHPHREQTNAAAAEAGSGSWLHQYRLLIALRHQDSVVAHGSFELLLEDDADLWAFTRTLGEQQLLVVANCSDRPRQVPFDGWADEETVLHTGPKGTEADVLGPWAARVTRRVVGR